jgi:RHS repeat-associated protein
MAASNWRAVDSRAQSFDGADWLTWAWGAMRRWVTCTPKAAASSLLLKAHQALAVLALLACANAHAVTYSGLSVTPPGGAVAPGGTLQVKFDYKVTASNWPGLCGLDAVKAVELRESGVATALDSDTYTAEICSGDNGTEYIDHQRVGSFTTTLTQGTHRLYLRTYTKRNTLGVDSTAFTIEVTPNSAPSVTLTSPADGATLTLPAGRTTYSVPIKGTATDSDGSVVNMTLTVDTSAPQTFSGASVNTTKDLAPGTHTIKLTAKDNLGATRTDIATFTVARSSALFNSQSQTTTGGAVLSGGTLTAGINFSADMNGACDSINKVELREGTTVLKTVTYTVKHTACAEAAPLDELRSGTLSASLGIGSHSIYLRAYSEYGQKADSNTYQVNVTLNKAPTGSLTAPSDDAAYVLPYGTTEYTVPIKGTTSDSDGSVSSVEVVVGSTTVQTVIGSAVNTTYDFPAGTHAVKLRPKDNLGTKGDSNVATITVTPSLNSDYVSQVVPTVMVAGRSYSVSVTMKNTGANTWPANSTTKLGSQNPQGNSTWGLSEKILDTAVAPGGSKTITFNVTAPSTAGTYNFQWRMAQGANWFGDLSTNQAVKVVLPAALTVSRTPAPLIASEAFKLTWTSANATKVEYNCTASGTGYTASGPTATLSGTSNGTADKLWVGYPSTCTWTATGEGNANTKVVTETMTTNAPVHDAELLSVSVPDSMEAGKAYSATVKLKNTGNGTWFAGSSFQLASQNPAKNTTWGPSTVNVAQNVAPGADATFTVAITAPSTAGVYDFDWQMIRDGSVWFGPVTSATVSVVADSALTPVPITPPHLANANAGTLPGELGVSNAGAATYSIPIEVPPGTAGLKPSLSLSYSSQGTNGPLGLGWSLSGLSSIHRCGQTIAQDGVNGRIRFDQGDRLCLDGQRLVLVNKPMSDANYWADDAEYRTEIDSISRITASLSSGKRSFKVETKDHRVMVYGSSASGRNSYVRAMVQKMNVGTPSEYPPAGTDSLEKAGALSWAVDSIEDRAGNYIRFTYEQDLDTGEHRPSVIRYGGVAKAAHAAVQFVYEARSDAWKRYVDDARNDLRSRISHIKTYQGANLNGDVQDDGTLVRDYVFTYAKSQTSGRSMLTTAQVCARSPQTAQVECLPATTFEWGQPDAAKAKAFVSRGTWAGGPSMTTSNVIEGHTYYANHSEYFAFADFENHGYTDVLEMRVASPVPLGQDTWDFFTRDSWRKKDANSKAAGTMQSQYRYFHNTGSAFALYQYKLSTNEDFVVLQTGDFNGDGAPDLLVETAAQGPKICLSPLGKNGPQSATIIFNCNSGLAATGQNTNYGIPHVIDVVGDGRSSLYGRYDNNLRYAILCIQDECLHDTGAPISYLGYTFEVCCNPPSPLSSYVQFDEMVDFAGTGKQQAARWTQLHYVKNWCDDGGQTCTYVNAWQNTQPTVFMTGFRKPNSADSAYGAGSLAPYQVRDPYVIKGCDQNGCGRPTYGFDAGKNVVGDFNGSGYSSLLFGFLEFQYPNDAFVYSRAELTPCLSTGRRLDCGVRRKYSGDAYVAPTSVGNYVGDGAPSFRGLPTKIVDSMMQYGPRQMCRIMGDDTTGGTGTSDTNIVCEPWAGLDAIDVNYAHEIDLLGTGRTQVVTSNWELFEPVDRAKTNQALDRVHAVTNGLGARSSVEYVDGVPSGTVTRSGTSTLSYPQHVTAGTGKIVQRLIKDNGASADRRTAYQYEDAGIDVAGRGSLGFAKVTITDEQTGVVTTTKYSQQWPYVGMVVSSTVTHPSSPKPLSTTTNTLATKTLTQANGRTTACPFVGVSVVDRYDLGGQWLGKVTTKGVDTANVQYDGYCNLQKMQVVSEGSATDANATFTTKTENTYVAADVPNWLMDLVSKVSVAKTHSADTKSITRTKDFTYETGATGRVKTETIQSGDVALKLTVDYDRAGNVFGLVNSKTETWRDPVTLTTRTRKTSTTYDANGRLPITVTNPASHSETLGYDYGSGAMTSRVDPNLLSSAWIVDGFGRVTVEIKPDGNETQHFIKKCDGACPTGAVAAKITDHFYGIDRNAVPQVTYLDSAGRVLQSKSWGFDGRVIVSDLEYDTLGRLWKTYQPRYSADAAVLASRQVYDDLGRVIDVFTSDENGGERSLHTDYQGMVTVVTNPKSQKRTDKRDVLGLVREVVDDLAGVTKFAYDSVGNLTQTIDPNTNVINVTFDDLGRKTQLKDPDLGQIDYVVDPLGRTRKQISPIQRAASKFTETDYDALDRMTLRMEPDLESHWVYDTATKGKGQLAEAYTGPATDKDYRRVHTYDGLGRPSTVTQTLTDGDYKATSTYDTWGRVSKQTYQRGTDAAKVYDIRYNTYGYQSSVDRAGLALWQPTEQDASNRVLKATLGNGLVQERDFSAYTGRLAASMLKTASLAVRLQEGYVYDPLGNVTRREQYWDTLGFGEDFAYDNLNRLKNSEVDGQAAKGYTYDAAGNIKTKTGTGTYTYPTQGASAVRPHAVTSISGIAGSFSYDDNGNLKSGAGRKMLWSSFDMPTCITKGLDCVDTALPWSRFVYGTEHQRVKQTRNDGAVIIYAGAQEVETKAGVTTVKTYWPNGIGVEIDKTGQSTQLMWTHVDRLGSVVAITDANGNLAEKLEYDPWGKRRSVTDSNSTPDSLDGVIDNKGFTRHEMLDQLDLVHMNGRVYDPWTAKFVSGDPIVQELNNGQSYNRYAYVVNNPTNLTDPTGFARTCTAQTGSNIPICAGADDVVVHHVDGSREVLLGNGQGKTIESLGGRITKNGIEMVNAKAPQTGAGTNSSAGSTQGSNQYDGYLPSGRDPNIRQACACSRPRDQQQYDDAPPELREALGVAPSTPGARTESRGKDPLDVEKWLNHMDKEASHKRQGYLPPNGQVYLLQAAASDFYTDIVHGGVVWLNKGEIWKIGTTINGLQRYTGPELNRNLAGGPLIQNSVYFGLLYQIKVVESLMLGSYHILNSRLPPGNAQEWN